MRLSWNEIRARPGGTLVWPLRGAGQSARTRSRQAKQAGGTENHEGSSDRGGELILSELRTPEKLRFFLMFSVPGFIILYFRAQFKTGRLPPLAEGLVSINHVAHVRLTYERCKPLVLRNPRPAS
jgi:hypothetical protein